MKISNLIGSSSTNNGFNFQYIENCNSENKTSFGSSYPIADNCQTNEIGLDNYRCNSLFNNNTKRKTLVNKNNRISNVDIITNINNTSFLNGDDINKEYRYKLI